MLLIRLLAIFLVLITNTWLLNPVRSDALRRYKRGMARRADRELSSLAGEPCAVSGVWRSRRQLRSLSPSQHRPPVARPMTHTSRRELYAVRSAPEVCADGCGFDTGGLHRVGHEKGSWGDATDTAVGAGDGRPDENRSRYFSLEAAQQPGLSLLKDAGQTVSSPVHAQSQRGSRSRLTRSLRATLSYEEEVNSSWDNVFPDSSAEPTGLRVLHKLQDGGDQQSSTGTSKGESHDDYSGEVEEVDAPTSLHVGSSSPWGSPVPGVSPSRMTALYFSGHREQLKLNPAAGLELPSDEFSVELWVNPEGGQNNPAVIAGG